jgi:integrase
MFQVGDKYRVTWYDRGKRRSRRFDTRKEAALFEARLKAGDVRPEEVQGELTFSEFAERWLRDHCQLEKHESQWAKDRRWIVQVLGPAFGAKRLSDLRKSDLESLKARLRIEPTRKTGKPLSPRSVNLCLALAKKMLASAVDWELLPANPFRSVKRCKVQDEGFQFWTVEERDRFLEEAGEIDPGFTLAVRVAVQTGLRLGELAALTVGDLDFVRRKIRVRASFNFEMGKRFENVKGKRAADVPMNADLARALDHLRGSPTDQLVFPRVLLADARKRLGRLAKRVGVTPIRFHDLRHTFASHLAMAGVDLMRIQEMLRHRSYQMTLRYAHLHPDHLRGATEALVPAPNRHRAALKEA